MPSHCCACGAKGACKSCSCVVAGERCTDCIPGMSGKCHYRAADRPQSASGGEILRSSGRIPSSCPPKFVSEKPNSTVRTDAVPTVAGNVDQNVDVDELLHAARAAAESTSTARGDTAAATTTAAVPSSASIIPGESSMEAPAAPGNQSYCCSCSSVGTCERCSCAKSSRLCTNCVPKLHRRCKNFLASVDDESDALSAEQTTPGTPVSSDSGGALARSIPEVADDAAQNAIVDAYELVVGWRRNLFIVPFGSAGSDFVDLLANSMLAFKAGGESRATSWKEVVVACHLLLQKPNDNMAHIDAATHLSRRLRLWKAGRIPSLLDEGLCIQTHLPSQHRVQHDSSKDSDVDDQAFSRLVFTGRVHSAIRLVCSDSAGGVLHMEDLVDAETGKTVHDVLLEKHPEPADPPEDALLDPQLPTDVNPILFEKLTPELLKKTVRSMSGSAGPSGLDAEAWKRMMICFKKSSQRLCSAMAAVARCICTEKLSPHCLSAFTAARLIPLDKRPGVRPIAVGEVFRRVICKAIANVVEADMLTATAPVQLCVGVPSGCEIAVHAMDALWQRPDTEAILLVDATNAFNALNRAAALHNVPRVCPSLGGVFSNTYAQPCRLFVTGGGEIASSEGTCQGDPLAMGIYAVAVTPLIQRLARDCPEVTQSWYADDDSAAGRVRRLLQYWENIKEYGPRYGYYPNSRKTILLVKEAFLEEATELFRETGIEITVTGTRYLGGALGTDAFRQEFIEKAVEEWCQQVRRLAQLAETQPHAVYATLVHGMMSKWRYLLRVAKCSSEVLQRVDNVFTSTLLPLITGMEIAAGDSLRQLFALPTRYGGLNLPHLSAEADREHSVSVRVTKPLVNMIIPDVPEESDANPVTRRHPTITAVRECQSIARAARSDKFKRHKSELKELQPQLTTAVRLMTEVAADKGVSTWLTAAPSTLCMWHNDVISSRHDMSLRRVSQRPA